MKNLGTSKLRVSLATLMLVGGISSVAFFSGSGDAQEGQLFMGPATPVALGPEIPPEITEYANDWPAPMGNLASTRAAASTSIDASNVSTLEVAWRFPIEAASAAGGMTAAPIVAGNVVYVQDMLGNVFALNRETGDVVWEKQYETPTSGPNGVAIGYGMIFGTVGDTSETFALDAETGEEVWRVKLSSNVGEGIDMAPIVHNNTVYVSTVPGNTQRFYRGGQKGILYALEVGTGHVLWQFDTTSNLWGNPRLNSGGGLWYPPSVDEEGNIYFGVGNPGPWPGTPDYPNGSSRPGDNDYASSMVSIDAATGAIRWYHNAKPHDLFDADFQLTPILTTINVDGADVDIAVGAGKTGTVVAANADTGEVLWTTAVGIHENDELQEVPPDQQVEVWPGILGGVETPMAYANGTIFVPIVNMPAYYSATELDLSKSFDVTESSGELVALNAADGTVKWKVDLPQMTLAGATIANDLVFTGGLDGVFRAYNVETGDEVWSYQANAGLNAPPSIAGDMIFLPAAGALIPGVVDGTPQTVPSELANELIAFRLPGAGDAAEATPAG